MDSSISSAQNAQDKTASEQPINRAQPPVTSSQSSQPAQPAQPRPPQLKTQSVSVNKEAGPAMISQEASDESDEDEIKLASQETKNQAMQPSGGAEVQEVQEVEIQPSIPEMKVEKSIEDVVEAAPDQEKPMIPQIVKDAGVTHSGPGMITVEENIFGVTTLPKTYQQAVAEEKQTKIKDSKHWLLATVMYVWRKLNPKLSKKGATV